MGCATPIISGIVFENMGRYDTFGDVANALSIQACAREAPAHYSWFSIQDYVFQLPADLGRMMTYGLLLIIAMQVVPGLILLAARKFGAIALKLNEFCILINAIAREAYCDEEDDDECFDED